MLHPSFFDKTIFALQQDGTNKFAFMIDEQQGQSFQPKSLTELKSYFENIERKKIKAEQEKQEQIKQYHIEQERQQREQQRKRERIAEEEREKEERKKFILKQYKIYKVVKILGGILVCSPSLAWIDLFMGPSVSSIWGALFLYSMCPVYILILWYFYIKIMWKLEEYLIRKYNETQINNQKEQSRKKNRVEKRKQEREFRIKKEIEDNKRKIEERKKKEREWEEYRIQRDQRDFERIEKYRIEREKKERELKISKEENAKKEEEKNEQDLRGTELKIKEERRKQLKEEAFNIQCKLNSNTNAKELARQISLDIQFVNVKGLIFKVNWMCPNYTYKNISLIVNNGSDTLLYENLAIFGNQTIKLKEVKPLIRITLRLIWFDIPVYKIILIDKNEFI